MTSDQKMGAVAHPSNDDLREEAKAGAADLDLESRTQGSATKHVSAFQQLGILDRFLAVWIFLAMAVGIILGNFVPNTGRALQRGKFVGVSVPIGMSFWP